MAKCKLSDCPVAKDGRCLEGHGNDCPNLLYGDAGASDTIDAKVTPAAPALIHLYSGNPLEMKEAREISGRDRTVVIAVVGLIECGKTSLLARLHQLFQEGPIRGYKFAGSRTLLRF